MSSVCTLFDIVSRKPVVNGESSDVEVVFPDLHLRRDESRAWALREPCIQFAASVKHRRVSPWARGTSPVHVSLQDFQTNRSGHRHTNSRVRGRGRIEVYTTPPPPPELSLKYDFDFAHWNRSTFTTASPAKQARQGTFAHEHFQSRQTLSQVPDQ